MINKKSSSSKKEQKNMTNETTNDNDLDTDLKHKVELSHDLLEISEMLLTLCQTLK